MDTYLLLTYFLCFLTLLGMLFATGISVWRVASANYDWFSESMTFASRAADMNGNIGGVIENQQYAEQYFLAAMTQMMRYPYTLNDFEAVSTGDSVPGGSASAPGYLAKITVQIPVIQVPWLGSQAVNVPMTYFAVTKSPQI